MSIIESIQDFFDKREFAAQDAARIKSQAAIIAASKGQITIQESFRINKQTPHLTTSFRKLARVREQGA
jgi:hypothetical protein